ncbi:MAG: exocyst complex component exo70 [Claussenomyces sp. TS43310]|nr:MAG: exocyst complex component exo70 [Claussenomyces sp. TS43310]
MAVTLGTRHAADEAARAGVEALNSNLEKTSQLTKKIRASLTRLEESGRKVQHAIKPIHESTQLLQVRQRNIDSALTMIGRVRQQSDTKNKEEETIRAGPEEAGLPAFLASLKRISRALLELKTSNLKSNQQAAHDLGRLLKNGNQQLESVFQRILQEDSHPIEPLLFITKDKPFPVLQPERLTRLGPINSYLSSSMRQSKQDVQETPTVQIYARVRGPSLIGTLANLAAASVNTAKKKTPDAVYRQGTNGVTTYATAIKGAFFAEYDSICALFLPEQRAKVFYLTCRGAVTELTKTLRELDLHIRSNLTTDCYLAYEIFEIVSNLSSQIDSKTRIGELKALFETALKPIRDTGRTSLAELLEDTRRRVSALQVLPSDGAAVPLTAEVMTRLQTMVDFLPPVSRIMISLGDGNWKNINAPGTSTEVIPSLKSFDVGADGKQLFAHYCVDTIDALMVSLDQKGRVMLKGKSVLGVFLANNITTIDRMARNSDLWPLLADNMSPIDTWRKKGLNLYLDAWAETAREIMDKVHTNRPRPPSGSGNVVDSATTVRGLNSKEKDAIKEHFKNFNTTFDDNVARHKALHMEREVREMLGREVRSMIEALYGRFWDKYHEIDKGKGKYVKYDKSSISGVFLSLT